MKKADQLNRTCVVCSIEKPLAAFLQLSGTHGTVYGNICSSCRNVHPKGNVIIPVLPNEDESRGGTGLKIDAKTKIQKEYQQKQDEKKTKERTHEEKKKTDQNHLEKTENKELIEKSAKEHRTGYIDAKKKQTFSKFQPKKPATSSFHPENQQTILENQQIQDAQKNQAAIEQDIKTNQVDVSQLGTLPLSVGFIKMEGAAIKQFKDWLGTSANFRTMERLYKNKPTSSEKSAEKKAPSKDPFIQYVEETFKPGSSRKK